MKSGPMTKKEFEILIGEAGFISTGEYEMTADKQGGMTHVRVYCYRLGERGIEKRQIGYYEDTLGAFGEKVVGGIYPDLVFGKIGEDARFREAFEVGTEVVEPSTKQVADKAAVDVIEAKSEVLKAVLESSVSDCRIVKAIVNEGGVATEKHFAVLGEIVLPCKEKE